MEIYSLVTHSPPPTRFHYVPIFEDQPMQKHYTEWSEKKLTESPFNGFDSHISILDGSNLHSLEILLRKSSVDLRPINRRVERSSLTNVSTLRDISIIASMLIIVGVIIPVTLLITPPISTIQTMPNWLVFGVEVIVVILSSVLIFSLLELNLTMLEKDDMELEYLSPLTTYVIKKTPLTKK